MNQNIMFFRDKLVPKSDANVSVLSGTAQYGLNVFEGIRCYWNSSKDILYAFRLTDHLDRLFTSCKLLGLEIPATIDEITSSFAATIQANSISDDVAVRLTVFHDEEGSWHSTRNTSYYIATMIKPRTAINEIPKVKACISSWQRINDNVLPPRAKVGANYLNSRYAFLQARHDGYDFPIMLNHLGQISESSGSCLFLIKEDELITPRLSSGILESITRNTILHLAKLRGLNVVEREVERTELYVADEVFLCGTAAEIIPVVEIDRFVINNGATGPYTLELLKTYHQVVSGEVKHPNLRIEKVKGQ